MLAKGRLRVVLIEDKAGSRLGPGAPMPSARPTTSAATGGVTATRTGSAGAVGTWPCSSS